MEWYKNEWFQISDNNARQDSVKYLVRKAFHCVLFFLVLLSREADDWKPPYFSSEGIRGQQLAFVFNSL